MRKQRLQAPNRRWPRPRPWVGSVHRMKIPIDWPAPLSYARRSYSFSRPCSFWRRPATPSALTCSSRWRKGLSSGKEKWRERERGRERERLNFGGETWTGKEEKQILEEDEREREKERERKRKRERGRDRIMLRDRKETDMAATARLSFNWTD